jgi:hypothetical protein
MILQVHQGLGDQIMHTGLPEAYYKIFGEKIGITGHREELWQYNQYVDWHAEGNVISLPFNQPRDYMIYYPVRLFYDFTGWIVNKDLVQPNIYIKPDRNKHRLLVNDQSGWPTRVGYPYFEELIVKLRELFRFEIRYIRNENFRNCIGQCPPRELSTFDVLLENLSLDGLIYEFQHAGLYVGYDSGLAQLAGATNTPYVLLEGPVAPINTVHNSCVWYLDLPNCKKCNLDNCFRYCLSQAKNYNPEIIWNIGNLK